MKNDLIFEAKLWPSSHILHLNYVDVKLHNTKKIYEYNITRMLHVNETPAKQERHTEMYCMRLTH